MSTWLCVLLLEKLVKIYFLILLLIIILVAVFGFICPMLISAASSEAVILGMFILALTFPAIFYIVKIIFKGIYKK